MEKKNMEYGYRNSESVICGIRNPDIMNDDRNNSLIHKVQNNKYREINILVLLNCLLCFNHKLLIYFEHNVDINKLRESTSVFCIRVTCLSLCAQNRTRWRSTAYLWRLINLLKTRLQCMAENHHCRIAPIKNRRWKTPNKPEKTCKFNCNMEMIKDIIRVEKWRVKVQL